MLGVYTDVVFAEDRVLSGLGTVVSRRFFSNQVSNRNWDVIDCWYWVMRR